MSATTTSRDRISVTFGAMAQPLARQCPALTKGDAVVLQRDADAITRLAVRGLLSEGEARKARQRLMKRIAAIGRKAMQ